MCVRHKHLCSMNVRLAQANMRRHFRILFRPTSSNLSIKAPSDRSGQPSCSEDMNATRATSSLVSSSSANIPRKPCPRTACNISGSASSKGGGASGTACKTNDSKRVTRLARTVPMGPSRHQCTHSLSLTHSTDIPRKPSTHKARHRQTARERSHLASQSRQRHQRPRHAS